MGISLNPVNWIRDTNGYLKRINENFGQQTVFLLTSNYVGVKGFLFSWVVSIGLPFYKNMGVSAKDMQKYKMVSFSPWSIKALIGIASDAYPLFGYRKRNYMLLSTILASMALGIVSAYTFTLDTAWIASLLFFFVQLQISTCDLLCEGKYTELLGLMPETKSDIVTWVWFSVYLGSFFGSTSGIFADRVHPINYLFIAAIPFSLQIAFSLFRGHLQERFFPRYERKIQWGLMREEWKIFCLAFCMACGAIGHAFVALMGSDLWDLCFALGVSTFLCILGFFCLPPQLAKCNLYMFLQDVLYIQIDGVLDFYYTGNESCISGGPNFDMTYYITYTRFVQALAGILSVSIFQSVMNNWKIRHCFWISILLKCIASLFDIALVERLNIEIGIPDKFAYILGDAIILNVIDGINFMPAVILTAKLCPKNLEATTYAMLAGFQNFGRQVATAVGVYMMTAFNVEATENHCDFTLLPQLIFVCHFALPLLAIPLTFCLLPDAYLDDDLLDDKRGYDKFDIHLDQAVEDDAQVSREVSEVTIEWPV